MASGDTLFCTHCGTGNAVSERVIGKLKPCKKCKQQIVTLMALLADLRLIAAEVGECKQCRHLQIADHVYCFACGWEWRKKR